MKNVYLIPGFLASDLGVLSSGAQLWWDPNVAAVLSIGALRLAPNGIDPGAPDGLAMGVSTVGQVPWETIIALLSAQLDDATWKIRVGPWDWRKDILNVAQSLATSIRNTSTAAEPATIVGHSAGGLVAVLAWSLLVASGDTAKCRRIISICTPFQGSYAPLQWLLGVNPSVQQLLSMNASFPMLAATTAGKWALDWLNALALTWPAFYELFPALGGSEAAIDPNRALLYQAANYPAPTAPDQGWLDYSRLSFQRNVASPDTFPPSWVMTCVVSSGLPTPFRLTSAALPLRLNSLAVTSDGDSVVTSDSQARSPALIVDVFGDHASVPLAIAGNGLLAQLILDPRGPLTPPPPAVTVLPALPATVTYPPESDYLSGLVCLGGG